MEYKIGQRVKHVGAEFYIESIVGDAAIIGDEEITHIVRLDGLSPLYKPGDQVRVKSRVELEELEKVYASPEFITKFAGTLQILKEINDDIGGQNRWNFEGGGSFVLAEDRLEWHSGVEDKPDVQLYPTQETSNYNVLIAEVHQDKERNRAALAEVLKIKETPQQLWKCPYYDNHTHRPCNETGSKHDIRQHSKTAHGEALPPTNSPVWEHWRVS